MALPRFAPASPDSHPCRSQPARGGLRCAPGGRHARMLTGLLRILCLVAGLGATALASAQAPPRAEIGPRMDQVDLAPYMGVRVDPEGRADAAAMFEAAAAGTFAPLPGGRPTFSFADGAYWFHVRLFNAGHAE